LYSVLRRFAPAPQGRHHPVARAGHASDPAVPSKAPHFDAILAQGSVPCAQALWKLGPAPFVRASVSPSAAHAALVTSVFDLPSSLLRADQLPWGPASVRAAAFSASRTGHALPGISPEDTSTMASKCLRTAGPPRDPTCLASAARGAAPAPGSVFVSAASSLPSPPEGTVL
jgi:hypothetical protein